MNQFYIIEIQQYVNGEFGHIVHRLYPGFAGFSLMMKMQLRLD